MSNKKSPLGDFLFSLLARDVGHANLGTIASTIATVVVVTIGWIKTTIIIVSRIPHIRIVVIPVIIWRGIRIVSIVRILIISVIVVSIITIV